MFSRDRRFRNELVRLMGVRQPSSAQLRRIAELTEALYGVQVAYPWWCKAARAGDREAQDILRFIKLGENPEAWGNWQ